MNSTPHESRTVLLTGAGGGIGGALVPQLVAKGYRVLATDCDEHRMQGLEPGTHLKLATLDVRQPEQWQHAIDTLLKHWQRFDILLNIAGVLLPGRIGNVDGTNEEFAKAVHRHIDINLKGVIFGTHLAARQMQAVGGGHIVNMASLAAITPVPGLGLYAASKFGVRGLTLSAAFDLRAHGIAVSLICPDAVQTPMLDLQRHYPEAALTFSGSKTPLTADYIAQVIVGEVLVKKPLEVLLPQSRGILAKLGGLWPALGTTLAPWLSRKGRKRQLASGSPGR